MPRQSPTSTSRPPPNSASSCGSTRSGPAPRPDPGTRPRRMSAADLMAVLLARHLRYDWDNPDEPGNDHLIFSKGHASPLLYSMYKAVGVVSDEELMTATGGSAPGWRATPPRCCPGWTWPPARSARACPTASAWRWPASTSTSCPTGSGCCAATARWPRARCGRPWTRPPYYELANLIAIVDVNRLGQRGPTELGWDLDAYAAAREAFGAPRHRDRRPRRRRDRRGPRRGRRPRPRPADGHPRQDHQGPTASPRSRTTRAGTASRSRRTWPSGPSPSSAASATCSSAARRPPTAQPRPARRPASRGQAAGLRPRRRRWPPARPTATRWPRSARRPDVVALDGEVSNSTYAERVRQGASRALLRDVHRRAADGRRGGRARRARLPAVRLDLRRVLHPGLRLHPDGGHLPGQHLPGRLARRASRSARTGRPRWRWRTWP